MKLHILGAGVVLGAASVLYLMPVEAAKFPPPTYRILNAPLELPLRDYRPRQASTIPESIRRDATGGTTYETGPVVPERIRVEMPAFFTKLAEAQQVDPRLGLPSPSLRVKINLDGEVTHFVPRPNTGLTILRITNTQVPEPSFHCFGASLQSKMAPPGPHLRLKVERTAVRVECHGCPRLLVIDHGSEFQIVADAQ